MRALCAERAGESEAEQSAREIPTELLFDIARDWSIASRTVLEPALEALRRDLAKAIDEEKFEDAVRLRDEINALAPTIAPPPSAGPP